MAGINLSQSIKEKQELARGNFFDRSFFMNVGVFLLVAGVYGGTEWYLGTFEAKLAAIETETAEKRASLKSREADQVADIQARLETITGRLEAEPSPEKAFSDLEQSTLPTIRLTEYSRRESEDQLVIRGKTASLRYLAQQMLAYKKIPQVTSIHVETVRYNDAGEIEFELHLLMVSPSDQPVSTSTKSSL